MRSISALAGRAGLGGLAGLLAASIGCGTEAEQSPEPMHPRGLLALEMDGAVRLFAAGFGDGTLRGYAANPLPELSELLAFDLPAAGFAGAGSVGATVVDTVRGAWEIARTEDTLLLTGRLAHAVTLFSLRPGPLAVELSFRQGALVDAPVDRGQDVGLVPVRGLDRAGPVTARNGFAYVGGRDGLAMFDLSAEPARYAGHEDRLAGADALLALAGTSTGPAGQLLLARCRDHVIGDPCFLATDEAELVVFDRQGPELTLRQRIVHGEEQVLCTDPECLPEGLELPELLGNGYLAVVTSTGAELVLAAFEGSATVLAFERRDDGLLDLSGTRRVVPPWQSPDALPPFDSTEPESSLAAPLRVSGVVAIGDQILVAAANGGFVQALSLECLRAEPDAPCGEIVCLDEQGGCVAPSAASPAPTYLTSITASYPWVFVGLDVVDSEGGVTGRIAVLELGPDGPPTLVGLTDA